MAKSLTRSVQAFQFIFKPKDLKKVLESDPDQVVFTVNIVEEVTKSGEKVGALKINAKGVSKKGKIAKLALTVEPVLEEVEVPGCPVPPCNEEEI
jgi:hypothetical protein